MTFLAESGDEKYFFLDRYIGSNRRLKAWVYITTDDRTTVTTAGYFDDIEFAQSVMPGDRITVLQASDRNDLSTEQDKFEVRVTSRASTSFEVDLVADLGLIATQQQAEDGTSNGVLMTPLRTNQHLTAFLEGSGVIIATVFGAVGDGVTDDTEAINDAIESLGAAGGIVFLPPGTFLLSNSNPGAANWDNYRAIYVGSSNIHIVGAGRGATVLKLADGADCHVVKFGSRVTSVVTVSDCSLSGVEIDGNRANQTAPTDSDDHWHGVDIVSGCSRIHIYDFYIHDCQYYGIGGQRTNIRYSTIENGVIENTGADGIDWKNDDGDGRGNAIRDITLINPGLATSLSLAQAALDLRSGIYFENITIHTLTAENDLVGLRINIDANSAESDLPQYPTTGNKVTIVGNNLPSSYGARIGVRNTRLDGLFVRAFAQGVRISAPDVKLSNFDVHANEKGIVLTAGSSVEADTCQLVNGTVRDSTEEGILYDSVDEATSTNVDVRSNGTGHSISAGSTNIRIIGGSCSGNSTNLSDSGSGTLVDKVSGLKTYVKVSTSIAIDSTGIKSIQIAHGLSFTPSIDDVRLQLKRNTNVGDWSAGFLWITSADATNINGQLNVLTASATVGAVVDVVATIVAKAAQ